MLSFLFRPFKPTIFKNVKLKITIALKPVKGLLHVITLMVNLVWVYFFWKAME